MSTVAIAVRLTLALLVVTPAAAGAVAGPPTVAGGTDNTSAAQGTLTVADLRERIQAEMATLDALLETLREEERIYAELADAQFERVVLRSAVGERISSQAEALADLDREFYRMQDEPERVADLVYELQRSLQTLSDLRNATEAERLLVGELRTAVAAENGTLGALDTPLAGALADQRASQLRGLDYLADQLAIQDERLGIAQVDQQRRLGFLLRYRGVWRELETVARNRVLDRLDEEFDATFEESRLQASRLEGQRYVLSLLREHHLARMETVLQYRLLLADLDGRLAALGNPPTRAEVRALRAALEEQAARYEVVRRALANESAVASELRREMADHERLLDRRRDLLVEQLALVARLGRESTPAKQNRTLDALDAVLAEEAALFADLDAQIRREGRLVEALYSVGADVQADGRIRAYLRVRDRIADLLVVNLERQAQLLATERADLRAKNRSVIRLRHVRGVQDLWNQLPSLRDELRASALDEAVLEDRFADQTQAFGLLADLRREADRTFAGEQTLLLELWADLERVETAAPETANATTLAVDTVTTTPTSGGGTLGVVAVVVVLVLAAGLLVWLAGTDRLERE